MKDIIEACKYLLYNFPKAKYCLSYLNNRLSLTSQNNFDFGYFPSTDDIDVLTTLVSEEILYKNKLIYSKTIEDSLCPRTILFSYFDNYPLIMPFRDVYGDIVAIVGRTLLTDSERSEKKIAKYKNTIFPKGNFVFGLYENKKNIIENNSVFIVEGQFDVIKATEKGLNNIIALGCSNMTSYQFSVISRYTNNMFLLLDNDEAGEKGRHCIIDKFGKYANIQNFYLSNEYKDIDEYLTNNSYESISYSTYTNAKISYL